MIPPKLEREVVEAWAQMYESTVAYFVDHDVRVVNMSWGGSISDLEAALAAHNDPADPEERKALAREYFEIMKAGLVDAMSSAPEILFCVAAGNSDNDNEFEEMIPSSIDLDNMITVGAVDQAGEETSFTTFGKVDVYANGFDVLSYVPGGDQLSLNGTSMASPQVANLAAKILANSGLSINGWGSRGCAAGPRRERTVKISTMRRCVIATASTSWSWRGRSRSISAIACSRGV